MKAVLVRQAHWGSLSRPNLFFASFSLSFANIFAAKISGYAVQADWQSGLVNLYGISVFILAAAAGSLILLSRSDVTERAGPLEILLVVFLAICCFAPLGVISRITLALASGYLLLTSPRGTNERRAATIAFSLAGPLLVGPSLLWAFEEKLTTADAWLVGAITGFERSARLVAMNDGAGWLSITGTCSSVHGMSLAIVAAVTFTQFYDAGRALRVFIIALAATMATVAINAARLTSMALYPDNFEWLHIGWGAAAFSSATMLVIVIICFIGTRHEPLTFP